MKLAGTTMPTRAEWPAWVQAIGSIGAIIGAVLVAYFQNRNTIKLARRAEEMSIFRAHSAIAAIIDHANDVIQEVAKNIASSNDRARYFQNIYSVTMFEEAIGAVGAIPLHETGSYDIVNGIRRIKSALEGMRNLAGIVETDPDGSITDLQEVVEISVVVAANVVTGHELVRKSIQSFGYPIPD